MNIIIKGTGFKPTEAIKEYVEEKIGHLAKYIQATEANVELGRDRHHKKGDVYRAEVMLHAGGKIIRADHTSEDIFASVDMVIPKIKEQIAKFKDKRTTLERRGARSAKRKY